jgi:hypothetical protein
MMNPAVHLREAERIQSEMMPSFVPLEGDDFKIARRGYTHERLPSGCIVYRMAVLSKGGSARESDRTNNNLLVGKN